MVLMPDFSLGSSEEDLTEMTGLTALTPATETLAKVK